MALTANSSRSTLNLADDAVFTAPVVADDHVFAGAFLSDDSNNAAPLAAGDALLGVALTEADNSGGAAGDLNVRYAAKGVLTGAAVAGSGHGLGDLVYASDDDTLTLTSTSNTAFGRIAQINADGTYDVAFSGAAFGAVA